MSRVKDGNRHKMVTMPQEGARRGHMAPKPKPAWFEFTVGMVVAMTVSILAITTWAVVAAPSW